MHKKATPGRPFVKGDDPRRNLKGRPRSFDQARSLAQEIVHQDLPNSGLTVIEAIFRQWAKDPKHQRDLVEYAFGKVPDKLEAIYEQKSKLYLNYSHEESNVRREDHPRLPATVSPGTN